MVKHTQIICRQWRALWWFHGEYKLINSPKFLLILEAQFGDHRWATLKDAQQKIQNVMVNSGAYVALKSTFKILQLFDQSH